MSIRRPQQPRPKEVRPVNWSRLRQLHTGLTYRRQPVLDGLVFIWVVVEARGPAEMVAKTEREMVTRTLNEPET